MRAALVSELGHPPHPSEHPDAVAAEGQVVLDVDAVALNPVDIAIASGGFYAGHPPLPFVPGIEAVGRVGGDRLVYAQGGGRGIAVDGLAAERVAVPEAALIDLPSGSDPATAAALGTAGLAGWLSVTWRGQVQPGDVVVVLGATGAVGRVAVQAARRGGADRVVGVGRSQDRLADLGSLVDEAVVIGDDLADRVLAAAGSPPTLVVDMLWGAPLASIVGTMAPGGRVVHVGASAGPEITLPSAPVRGKQLTVLGYSNFGVPRETLVAAYQELVGLASAGELTLPTRQFPLDEVGEAWRVAAGGSAKVVLRLGPVAPEGAT